jgi:hypothetical protein
MLLYFRDTVSVGSASTLVQMESVKNVGCHRAQTGSALQLRPKSRKPPTRRIEEMSNVL